MHPQLAAIEVAFHGASDRLHRLQASVRPDQWAARPAAASWSAAECVAHLNLTSHAYLPLLRAAVEQARSLGVPASRRYRRDPLGWLFSVTTGPLPGIGSLRFGRARTTAPFVPGGELPQAAVVAEFDRLQLQQLELLRAAAGLPLDRVRVTSPFVSRFHYNAYACFVILPRHQHRHLAQAERAVGILQRSSPREKTAGQSGPSPVDADSR